jgi:vesicle-fusing ATPase
MLVRLHVNLQNMQVTMKHFEHALQEVKPAFGVQEEDLKKFLRGGFFNYGTDFNRLLDNCNTLIEQVRSSPRTPLMSILLHGEVGAGKTALATYDRPFFFQFF